MFVNNALIDDTGVSRITIMEIIMTTLAYILSGLSLLLSVLLLIPQPKFPLSFWFLLPKLPAGALSPYWAVMGVVGAVIGWGYQALWAVPMGILGAGTMIWYVWRCTRDHNGFENAFGAGWEDQIPSQQAKHMVKRRWSIFLKMKTSPEPILERDIAFCRIPDTDQDLLCDIWRPADGEVSGLALVFLHGSAWAVLNKDYGTQPFFRHLAVQGHTVMDVAYRLIPEVDIYGMVGDAKRAVAWMKANADRYGVKPEKIVLGGASAGAHIALLAGYTPEHPELKPEDLKNADLSVCGVVSYYGNTDLVAGYEVFDVKNLSAKIPPVPIGTKVEPRKSFNYAGRLDILLGGHPEEVPEMYRLACPTTHVHPGSPPTLLMQGEDDFLVPVSGTFELFAKLVESDVPAINVVFPWTDHGFDLLLPQVNPAAQSALYEVDRFLALMLNRD
jgi:acetyl esterase/lipase